MYVLLPFLIAIPYVLAVPFFATNYVAFLIHGFYIICFIVLLIFTPSLLRGFYHG